MRNFLIGLSPVVLTLTAFSQQAAAPKPAVTLKPSTTAIAAPSLNTTPPPEHPLTNEQAHQLMELTGASKLKPELIDNMHKYFARSFPPFVPQDVKDDLNTSIEKMDVDTPVIDVYKKYISTEDATKAIEFYKTPAGHRIAESESAMNTEVQKAATQVGQQTAKETIDRHRPEIEAAQKKYQEEHAAKPAPAAPGTTGSTGTPGATGAAAPAPPAPNSAPATPPAAAPKPPSQ